jgi:hypothetical protein
MLVLGKSMNKDNQFEKIHSLLQNNMNLLTMVKNGSDEENELILLIILYELRKETASIITEMQIADG